MVLCVEGEGKVTSEDHVTSTSQTSLVAALMQLFCSSGVI